jgi:hypothetical protein
MVAGFEDGTLYMANILNIDENELNINLKASLSDAYNMSVNCSYPTQMNSKHILTNALSQSRALVTETGAYSPTYVELLLAPAIRMQNMLENKVGKI